MSLKELSDDELILSLSSLSSKYGMYHDNDYIDIENEIKRRLKDLKRRLSIFIDLDKD